MSNTMIGNLHFVGMVTAVIAALMISADISRRVTGYGFVIFTLSSVVWVAAAIADQKTSLGIQNGVLFFINVFGIYRYLLRRPLRQRREAKPAPLVPLDSV
ncbi:MAG TPA: hypothetical protein VIK87_12525 [Sphingomonadales bacterium]